MQSWYILTMMDKHYYPILVSMGFYINNTLDCYTLGLETNDIAKLFFTQSLIDKCILPEETIKTSGSWNKDLL